MKFILSIATLLMVISNANAQSMDDQISEKIAQKMKDSLFLTETQKSWLEKINFQLHAKKMEIWQQYTETDSIQKYLQITENMRDTLYNEVLKKEQYIFYIQKKKQLISN